MKNIDRRIDQYILRSADFAQPILMHLRDLVHAAYPDVEETMKWSFPHFQYNGKILCSMAAFKYHCSFGFWNGNFLDDPKNILEGVGKTAMGHLGKITSLKDLPKDSILISYIKKAKMYADTHKDEPVKPKKATEPKELLIPDYFIAQLKKNKEALKVFKAFSYSNQKEYVQWITEAKTETTRKSRITTAVEWLSEGKPRMWKYIKK